MTSPARQDLVTPRPWMARPMEPDAPGGAWEVVCPMRYSHGDQVVASYLSEDDAKRISGAPEAYTALVDVLDKAPHAPGCENNPEPGCTCYRVMARRAITKMTKGGP